MVRRLTAKHKLSTHHPLTNTTCVAYMPVVCPSRTRFLRSFTSFWCRSKCSLFGSRIYIYVAKDSNLFVGFVRGFGMQAVHGVVSASILRSVLLFPRTILVYLTSYLCFRFRRGFVWGAPLRVVESPSSLTVPVSVMVQMFTKSHRHDTRYCSIRDASIHAYIIC